MCLLGIDAAGNQMHAGCFFQIVPKPPELLQLQHRGVKCLHHIETFRLYVLITFSAGSVISAAAARDARSKASVIVT